MENIMLLILGVFISVMGILNIKGNISTIHSYNRRKVKEEDIDKDTFRLYGEKGLLVEASVDEINKKLLEIYGL